LHPELEANPGEVIAQYSTAGNRFDQGQQAATADGGAVFSHRRAPVESPFALLKRV
jgi:hypothetical protein